MTVQELENLFTPKNSEMLRVREALLQKIDDEVRLIRTNYPNTAQEYTMGLCRAAFLIRDIRMRLLGKKGDKLMRGSG